MSEQPDYSAWQNRPDWNNPPGQDNPPPYQQPYPQPAPYQQPAPYAQPYPPPPPAPPAKRGKGPVIIAVAVVVVLCAGLCGVGALITKVTNKDDWKNLGQPVSRPAAKATPSPGWAKPNMFNSEPDPQIRYELESWVLESAGVQKPTTSKCNNAGFTGNEATSFDCTITYGGQNVVYTVTASPSGQYTFKWDAKTDKNVVTREGIIALVSERYKEPDWSNLRCDEFPEVALMPVGQPLPQVCYAKYEDRRKTDKITITPDKDSAPSLNTEVQD